MATLVGYTGGNDERAPTYRSIGEHTEAVLVAYDPKLVHLDTLLSHFWQAHYPGRKVSMSQYRNVAFYHYKGQLEAIKASLAKVEQGTGEAVATAVEPAGVFYPAEDYHQKYVLKNNRSAYATLSTLYPEETTLVASTLAARLNGYLDGAGSLEEIEKLLRRPGIPDKKRERILRALP